MGMKPPANEPQSKICDYLSVPGPTDTGPHLPEANLVSSAKPIEGVRVPAPNLVAATGGTTTTKHPG